MSKITTFYSDKEKTNALYPITKTNAIYDNNNVNLEQRLNEALKLQMDLLWTNASPTSVFEPQTISLDLSSYTTFIIFFNLAKAGSDWASLMDKIYCCIFVKGKDSNTYAGAYKDYFMWRMISSNDNSITFGNSYYERGTDVVNNPNVLVPLEIYGVK